MRESLVWWKNEWLSLLRLEIRQAVVRGPQVDAQRGTINTDQTAREAVCISQKSVGQI